MLSICIPVFNYEMKSLLFDLSKQLASCQEKIEIILIDDCSTSHFRTLNEKSCSEFTYIKLSENIGRAKIRNLFVKHANFENLLFLDCDAGIAKVDYLQNYAEYLQANDFSVLFGGSIYRSDKPDKNHLLAWKYGTFQQTKSYEERLKNPNQSFMTNNFVVKKSVLEKYPFDERIHQYGHEDTLFGIALFRQNININHIDNAVFHDGIDDNKTFLRKVEKSIESLLYIQENIDSSEEFEQHIHLLHFYKIVQKRKLLTFLSLSFYLFQKPVKFLLTMGLANLSLLGFYKIGFYERLRR